MPKKTARWKEEPDKHDYPATADYLSLASYHVNENEDIPCRMFDLPEP
jgi:hypothetical protein